MVTSFRDRHRLDLAWTGPESAAISIRRTEQLILEIIEGTKKDLLVVTYAVHRPEKIRKALIAAASRGVQIRLVVDGQAVENPETSKKWSNILSLGRELRDNCELYVWPEGRRPRTRGGEPSKLHVKCIVADRKCLLVSSANLTVNAMDLNMELGLSITGFEAADRIAKHFEALMANGELTRVQKLGT
jgi:phosphatidylserine/phosphatidylglycerophosphate/cardiolipin synthase-like enzyme